MKYRPEIDGLRGIAVLAVAIFHIDNTWLQSGFLGVDIFFMISGYLITSIIKNQMLQGRFSFIGFYKSRMKRILPAFLVFVGVMAIFAKILLLQKDFVRFIESVKYALGFQANILFAKSADYFDILASEKPLLHIWSLSIEEQFYFIFPVLLLIIVKYFPKYILLFILALIALSLSSYFWYTLDSIGLDKYFLLRTRAYELLIGALFSCFTVREFKHNGYAWAFLLPIAILLFLPKDSLVGAGYIERLIICICAGCLILFRPIPLAQGEYYVLSAKPLVVIGLISYSLYLWHWGILALMRYVYMEYTLPFSYIIFAVCLMFICAYLSYFCVELPLKNMKTFSLRLFFGLVLAYLGLYVVVSQYYQFIKDKPDDIIYHHTTKEPINLDWDEETTCHDNIKADCGKGDLSKPATILMVGDSHAGQLNEFMNYLGKKEGWRADIITADLCRFFMATKHSDNKNDKCKTVSDYAYKNYQDYDIIVYGMYWYSAQRQPNFYQNLEQEIKLLTSQGKKVYLIKDNPSVNLIPLRMLKQKELGIHWYADTRTLHNEQVANDKIEKIADKYSNVYWIDIPRYIPEDLMLDNYPIYQDRDHINPYGAKQLGMEFAKNEKFLR